MAFSATWFLLEQEGLLAQSCLCNGLTALRHANLGDKKGLFYSAFFELSIGFERMLKLVLILDHLARNQSTPPDNKSVENYGHKLRSLFNAAKSVCATYGVTELDSFTPDSLPIVILGFLDDFAHPGGRYSNINKITGNKLRSKADPIRRWGEIANLIIRDHVTPRERNRAELHGKIASAAFGDAALSLVSDMDQQQIDVGRLYSRASELEVAAKYASYALVTMIAALREVLSTICCHAWTANPPGKSDLADIPNMNEFFQFASANKRYVMRKRQWP